MENADTSPVDLANELPNATLNEVEEIEEQSAEEAESVDSDIIPEEKKPIVPKMLQEVKNTVLQKILK